MEDHEIATKRLSDWKPEADIKLQKAFGKFVVEAGELIEAIDSHRAILYDNADGNMVDAISELEQEIADCESVITIIERVINDGYHVTPNQYSNTMTRFLKEISGDTDLLFIMIRQAGLSLSIVGRCQIQGIDGSDPRTGELNIKVLSNRLVDFRAALHNATQGLGLDKQRIQKRRDAKIKSKLPWVMGIVDDLIPGGIPLNREQHPAGSKVMVAFKHDQGFAAIEVDIDEWSTQPINGNDVLFSPTNDGHSYWYRSSDYIVLEKKD